MTNRSASDGQKRDGVRRNEGIALLITALCLLLVSLLSFSALRDSEQESNSGARSRSVARALHAGDAGFQLALARLTQTPPDLSAFSVTLPENSVVESRTRTDTSPQVLTQTGTSAPAEGYGINVDAGVSSVSRVYLVTVTANAGGSTTELESKLTRSSADSTGY